MINEEKVQQIKRMMEERRNYWRDRYNHERYNDYNAKLAEKFYGRADAYNTCAMFLQFLLDEDWENLNQYDYYGEE